MENIINKKAFSEVLEVLKYTDKNIINKIPLSFINFLKDNVAVNYIPSIDFRENNWENSLSNDAKAILALIYKNYII